MTAQPLRAAVVGVGAIGALHARAYHEHPQTTLVAVVDADGRRAREVGEQLGVASYDRIDGVLAHETLELASVATPEHERFEPAVALAEAGVHLLLEKPLAPTLPEAVELVRRVKATGVTATVNFILRSDPRYLRAKQAVADGTVGEPCTFFARRRGTSTGAEIYGAWTNLLISTAIHDIDVMVWLNASRVVRAHAEGVIKRCGEWGHEDGVVAVLKFENGAVGCLETSWVLPPTVPAALDASLHVVGTQGGVFIEGSNHGLAVVDQERYSLPDLTHWPVGRSGVEGDLQASIDRFVRSVSSGEEVPIDLDEALYAHEIVAALRESLQTGVPTVLPREAGGAATGSGAPHAAGDQASS